jgi:membrane protein DedA with SNARE-associated domain
VVRHVGFFSPGLGRARLLARDPASTYSAAFTSAAMDLSALIAQYGLLAVYVGACLEGETVLLLAGAAAHLGLLDIRTVIAVAALGAFTGDSFFYFFGRRLGPRLTQRYAWLARFVPRVDRLIERWRWGAVIAVRFMYGMRMAGPMLIGAGSMTPGAFLAANAVGALLWATVIGSLGHAAGGAIEPLLAHVAGAEKFLVAAVVLVGVAAFIVRRRRRSGTRH